MYLSMAGDPASLFHLRQEVVHVAPAVPGHDEMLHPRLYHIGVIQAEERYPGNILVHDAVLELAIECAALGRIGHGAGIVDALEHRRIVVVERTYQRTPLAEKGIEEIVRIVEVGSPVLRVALDIAGLARGIVGGFVHLLDGNVETGLLDHGLDDQVDILPLGAPTAHLRDGDVDTVRIAGLGEQGLGRFWVVFDRRAVGGKAGQAPGNDGVLDLALAVKLFFQNQFAVDGHLEGLAHTQVIKGFQALVHAEVVDPHARAAYDVVLPLLALVEIGNLGNRIVAVEHVEFVGLEQEPQGLRVGHHPHHDTVEFGPATEVFVIGHQFLAVVEHVCFQDEGTGATGGFGGQAELAAGGSGELAVEDRRLGAGHDGDERRVGLP
ncbi:hypothetical protein DESC_690057 [Desulfosarcina cetonica]|nr:hypothetical protein DESC_690057 [Desulfosarcina cetonica]